MWNTLPNHVVEAEAVDAYKASSDKFWMHQDITFDFAADLTGTGNRSEQS